MEAEHENSKSTSEKQATTSPGAKDEKQSATTSSPIMATIQDDDERLLARIGYKQVSGE